MSPQHDCVSLCQQDWVANMIDGELFRQNHKKEYEEEWMAKNRGAIFHHQADEVALADDELVFRQELKDKKLAKKNPQQYCADRCIATGNCDVYEDMFDLSADEVLQFCSDCVLVDELDPDHEECDIPVSFFDLGVDKLKP